jgi:hypothetical protein
MADVHGRALLETRSGTAPHPTRVAKILFEEVPSKGELDHVSLLL